MSKLADARPRRDGLPGRAYRIRTGESVRELSDWNFVITSPEVGASFAAETVRARAATNADLQLRPSHGGLSASCAQAGRSTPAASATHACPALHP